MKKNRFLKTAMAAIIILVSIAGCEKSEFIPANEPDAEEKSAALTDSSKFVDDDGIALEMVAEEIYPVNRVIDFVKYEYKYNQLVQMDYYKRVLTPATDAANSTQPVRTDKFFYDKNNMITGLTRTVYNVNKTPFTIKKRYRYDSSGLIREIIIQTNNGQEVSIRHEYLKYNNAGQMIKKVVRGRDIKFLYEYDRSGNLVKESKYISNRLIRIILFVYTPEGNVMYKQILRPIATAASVTDFRRGIIKYEYEPGPNPFKWMKIPYGTLFISMDELSNHNYIRIATPLREVRFKYRYSPLTGFPLVRYTIK